MQAIQTSLDKDIGVVVNLLHLEKFDACPPFSLARYLYAYTMDKCKICIIHNLNDEEFNIWSIADIENLYQIVLID